MPKNCASLLLFCVGLLALSLMAGCGGSTQLPPPPLSPQNVNLVFVASEDLTNHAAGDINESTANLTSQGLQRSLRMASFLQESVLGSQNVSGIYALEPMTHLQTANRYPDMVPLEAIQQFSVLNQVTLSSDLTGGDQYTGQNFPVHASYAPGSVPSGAWVPQTFCPNCQGIDFNDQGGDNEILTTRIIQAKQPGFYVFSAPWEATRALMTKINQLHGYSLELPSTYEGPNHVYAISIASSGEAKLVRYYKDLQPPSTYPVLPQGGMVTTACVASSPASITVTPGVGGAVLPAGINTDETFTIVRHAEAHPHGYWSDNNYVGAGQWRALDLPNRLNGKVVAEEVWSLDPAQFTVGTVNAAGDQYWSGIAPALTVAPYAIANGLPYQLLSSFNQGEANAPQVIRDFFFIGGGFSHKKVLLGSTFQFNPPIVNALLESYYPNGGAPAIPTWLPTNYDSIWILTIDSQGNLTVDFSGCQGIDSTALPVAPPKF